MYKTRPSIVAGLAVVAALGGVLGVAAPAQASDNVAYGTLQSSSNCPSPAANASCNVYLSYNGKNTTTHPYSSGTVNCNGSQTTVYSAIRSGSLNGKYVGVLWGGDAGAINCH